jgi:hypothetical protein
VARRYERCTLVGIVHGPGVAVLLCPFCCWPVGVLQRWVVEGDVGSYVAVGLANAAVWGGVQGILEVQRLFGQQQVLLALQRLWSQ